MSGSKESVQASDSRVADSTGFQQTQHSITAHRLHVANAVGMSVAVRVFWACEFSVAVSSAAAQLARTNPGKAYGRTE
jgi:hypothetical protein